MSASSASSSPSYAAPNLRTLTYLPPNSIPTSLTVQLFTDRVLVSVNQLGKIGSVLAANVDVSPANNKKTYNVEIMMGRRDDPLLEIYARQLIEKCCVMDAQIMRPLMLTISLKEEGRDTESFQAVLNKLLEMISEVIEASLKNA
ncbi:hypothetical protein TrCOL_g120 [Triparma columacea]|uniref:Proteasome assembly chaperone 3 n=1 Tax=Triparma columacea TaxID=722753 RepID=A0A9W7GFX6_9STRA|nr:hypothetical protein TrCOL_g120 [Triparma columacea]